MDLGWLRPERDALSVARDLLGAQLCRKMGDGSVVRWPVTEVEAYIGAQDKACHAAAGRTRRTEVLFGPPGQWYVYLCYGIHWLVNVVTDPDGSPGAVLLRGAGPVVGPGRLSRQLQVSGEQNRRPVEKATGFWIERGEAVPEEAVARLPRVGVDYAGPDWSQRPYRLIWTREWAGPRRVWRDPGIP